MSYIKSVYARQVLDSRGIPTVEVEVETYSGAKGRAIVPSGASTGAYEAIELRDAKKDYYNGKSVMKAVTNVNEIIQDHLLDYSVLDQRLIDEELILLDGTSNKSRLGANALLAVSMAVARCAADYLDLPLYQYIGGLRPRNMPRLMMNILNGGRHADNELDVQEFMIVPVNTECLDEALNHAFQVFYALKDLLKEDHLSTGIGDEGGFAPQLSSTKDALNYLVKAIEKAGLKPRDDIMIALDVASSEIYKDDFYYIDGHKMNSETLCDFYQELINEYPIISIEDGFDEDDDWGWKLMNENIKEVMSVGDDLFVTNKERLAHGIKNNMANSILIKLNQIGTLSETLETIDLAKANQYKVIVSHRSGESEDTFISDLAVAVNADYIKCGSINRSERIAKYNQLLRIEEDL